MARWPDQRCPLVPILKTIIIGNMLLLFFLSPLTNKSLKTHLPVYNPEMSFSRTWQPSLWNRVIKRQCLYFPVSMGRQDPNSMGDLLKRWNYFLSQSYECWLFLWVKPVRRHRWPTIFSSLQLLPCMKFYLPINFINFILFSIMLAVT